MICILNNRFIADATSVQKPLFRRSRKIRLLRAIRGQIFVRNASFDRRRLDTLSIGPMRTKRRQVASVPEERRARNQREFESHQAVH